jgi:hypothetical protein
MYHGFNVCYIPSKSILLLDLITQDTVSYTIFLVSCYFSTRFSSTLTFVLLGFWSLVLPIFSLRKKTDPVPETLRFLRVLDDGHSPENQ